MKIKSLVRISFVILSMVLFLTGCRPEPSQEQVPSTNTNTYGNQDTTGNIVILNQSNSNLLFYYEDNGAPRLLKRIAPLQNPNDEFLVNVPTNGNEPKILKMWQESQVANFLAPQSNPYRQWTVVLSNQLTDESSRKTWVVKDGVSTGTGSVSFSYDDFMLNGLVNSYSVDVYLDSQTGSKIASIDPGTEGKQIGLEYDTYSLFFKYWFSDPEMYNGVLQNVGWIELNHPISLNSYFNEEDISIPTYWDSSIGRIGTINITNLTPNTVSIFANNIPIENHVISNQPTTNISNLPGNRGYSLSMLEGSYSLAARRYSVDSLITQIPQIDLIQNCEYTWNIGSTVTVTTTDIEVHNNTDKKLSIHNAADGTYLGYVVNPGSVRVVTVQDTITSIRFMDLSTSNSGAVINAAPIIDVNELVVLDFRGPSSVTGLRATPSVGSIELNWTNPSDVDFSGVKVLRSASNFPLSPNDLSATLVYQGANSTYRDSEVVSGIPYYYSVFTYDTRGNFSESAATLEMAALNPSNVTGFIISPGNTRATFSWTNPTESQFHHVVLIRNQSHLPVNRNDGEILYQGPNTSYTDNGLTNGSTYYYAIFAVDGSNNYSSGITGSTIPRADTTPPGNVTNFAYRYQNSGISLSWTNPSDSDFEKIKIVRNEERVPQNVSDGTLIYNGDVIGQYNDTVSNYNTVVHHYKIFTEDSSSNVSNGVGLSTATYIFREDFESSTWLTNTTSYAGVWNNSTYRHYRWDRMQNRAASGSYSLGANGARTTYSNTTYSEVWRDVFLPNQSSITLTFSEYINTESNYDYLRIYVNNSQVYSSSGDSGGWRQRTVSLNQYAGQTIRLKFRFDTDYSVTREGVWIDEISIL